MNDQELIDRLSQASDNLLWQSESDYPLETVYIENVTEVKSRLLQITNCTPETKIKVEELDSFFKRATEEKDWYNEEEMLICQRYRDLAKLLKTHLTDIKVYRVGEIEVNCYIVGKTESGAIAGLSTISVET